MATTNKKKYNKFAEEMARFLAFVKERNEISDARLQASWEEVERKTSAIVSDRNRKMLRKRLVIGLSVAASVAILFFISFPFFHKPEDSSFISELKKDVMATDSLGQIKLVLSDNRHVELENDAVINYDKEGSVTINNHSAALADASVKEERKLNHIIVPKGRRTHITLSDGTKMYVNAASHVVYPSVFDAVKREIAVEGEVYLEVAENAKVPFIVQTNGLRVKVLGTVFNVTAYKENDISVVLVNGSVEVSSSAKGKMLLSPSQMVSLKDGIMKKETVDVTKYICWKDNIMLLDNDPASEVLERLSRYYGVSILYDKNVEDQKLGGKLDLADSIDDVMETIKESASLDMRKTEGGEYHFRK